MNIAVFSSHEGSDFQAIADGCSNGRIDARVVALISNNKDSNVLKRAKLSNVNGYYISSENFPLQEDLDNEILNILESNNTDIIFLAGYLKKIGLPILKKYENRIYNIHPALLPKYGGKGMYGINVHKAVIAAKEKNTGITVHKVNADYDDGEIVFQKVIPVLPDDTPESLAQRVLRYEHEFIVETISKISFSYNKI
jgi:phosphoribosylglycinamide formyltransferase-1